jgi:4'-phosphopantetheinyl transferase
LSAEEQGRAAALRTDKRRRDWLLGRWTAKRLVQSVFGEHLALAHIEIGNAADGAPFARLAGGLIPITLSHCDDYAVCAYEPPGSVPPALGADIERIAPRSQAFVSDYFTPREIALIGRVTAELRDTVVTATWSGKEAALKALHTGLRADTRAVEVRLGNTAEAPTAWTRFDVQCDAAQFGSQPPPLAGWWRVRGSHVLTMVTSATGVAA